MHNEVWRTKDICPVGQALNFVISCHDDEIEHANSKQPQSNALHYVWQYLAVLNFEDAKKGRAKNAVFKFCDKSFSCSEQQHMS